MTTFLTHIKGTLQELLLETNKAGLSNSDKNTATDRGHDEDYCWKWEPSSDLVNAIGHLEFRWCPSPQPPIQWVPGALYLGVKQQAREADHSLPSSAEVKE
jgi:hypothetical protein